MKRPVSKASPPNLNLQQIEELRERVRGTIRNSRRVTELAKTFEESHRHGSIEALRISRNGNGPR